MFVMYEVSVPSLLIESTDSMIEICEGTKWDGKWVVVLVRVKQGFTQNKFFWGRSGHGSFTHRDPTPQLTIDMD